jgi:NAD(P)-dependent dehydrogenase (short-subunit alcohol dehydrogenase family)
MPTTPPPLVRDYPDCAVVISGGSSGVGLASALAFANAGTRRVALLGRDAQRGQAAVARVRDRCPAAQVLFIQADGTDAGQAEVAVLKAHAELGGIDVLVNSTASAYRPELLHRTPMEDLAGIIGAMALPPLHFTRATLPLMREQHGGSIVNVASDAAKVATPGESVIGAAMAAIVMFTRVAAIEAKRDGVRVNAVTPSLIAGTPTTENVLRDGFSKGLFEKAAAQAHLGVTEPDDIAALIVFLGGPGAARLTGQAISVNGGISAS